MTFELQESIIWERVQIFKYFVCVCVYVFLIVNLQSISKTDLSKTVETELKCNGCIKYFIYSPGMESLRKYYNYLILSKSFNFSDCLLTCKMKEIDWLSRSNILFP